MNTQPRSGIFPWFTIIEGIMGFFLQCWLFSAIDSNKLLPENHIAGIACYCLLALTMVICWLGSRKEQDLCPDKLFFPSGPAAAGIGLSALGLAISSITIFSTKSPLRRWWWKETVIPSFRPESRMASRMELTTLDISHPPFHYFRLFA